MVDPNVILATRKWVEEYAGVKFTSLKALLDEHAGRRDNPHETGAAQVGAYTQAEVDGLLAAMYATFQAQLAAQEEAPGTIHLYSGPFSGIKAGWALCDGLEGRPDLADKFILGTAVEEEIGQTGGQGSHTHSVSGTVTGTALTVAQMPAHDHTVTALGAAGGTSFEDGSGWSAYFGPITTSSAGSGQAHGHGLNVAAQAASNLPPYYKLAFIIKL